MKKKKTIRSILLAVLLAVTMTAVPASAKSIQAQLQSLPSDLVSAAKLDAWSLSHLEEINELGLQVSYGNYEEIDKYLTDPDIADFFKRILNLGGTVAGVIKTTGMTLSPNNSERYMVPSITVGGSSADKTNPRLSNLDYSIFALRTDNKGKVNINVLLIYQDPQGNLVALGLLRNTSGQKLQIDNIPSIQLTANGKELASGTPSKLETPVRLAPHEDKADLGITDGLPTMCFIKMTFAPGTYDDSIDISNLDNVGCVFSLDYSVIQ